VTKIADVHALFSPSTIHMGPQRAHNAHDPVFPFTILRKFPVTKHTPSIIIFGWGNFREKLQMFQRTLCFHLRCLILSYFSQNLDAFSGALSLFLKAVLLNHVPGRDCFCVLDHDSMLAVQLPWLL